MRAKVGASAAVVLAAMVNAAAADAPLPGAAAADNRFAPDLSWALRGGGTHAARDTRTLLAQHAAHTIQSIDRLQTPSAPIALAADVPALPCTTAVLLRPTDLHTHSSHQHSAP